MHKNSDLKQVIIVPSLVALIVSNIMVITRQLTLEEEEASILRCTAVKGKELLLLPDPFFGRDLGWIAWGVGLLAHAMKFHVFEKHAPAVKVLGHLPLPLVPPVNLKHHLLKMDVYARNVPQHVPRLWCSCLDNGPSVRL